MLKEPSNTRRRRWGEYVPGTPLTIDANRRNIRRLDKASHPHRVRALANRHNQQQPTGRRYPPRATPPQNTKKLVRLCTRSTRLRPQRDFFAWIEIIRRHLRVGGRGFVKVENTQIQRPKGRG
jgi:hypothetical protein